MSVPFQIITNERIPQGWVIGIGDEGIVINVRGELLPLSFADIRQWQASAELAPPVDEHYTLYDLANEPETEEERIAVGDIERAAPVVTITPERIERGARQLNLNYTQSGATHWDDLTEERRDVYRHDARSVLDAALRGADLAPEPEGARDGQ